jgi:hypothetical protein
MLFSTLIRPLLAHHRSGDHAGGAQPGQHQRDDRNVRSISRKELY